MNPSSTFLLFFSILFLTGCAFYDPVYDTVRHETFSMSIPHWEQQEIVRSPYGQMVGVVLSDALCTLNFTLILSSPLLAALPYFERLQLLGPSPILDFVILDSEILITYALPPPQDVFGKLKFLSCPPYTYAVDYQCPSSIFLQRSKEIFTVLDSMDC